LKVAIIGAGVSGLACAITLEKNGIVPDVFEQLGQSGGRVPFHGALLQLMQRPVPDPAIDLAKRYGIKITPLNLINKIVMVSPGNVAAARGWLGYSYARGASAHSLESQLYGKLTATRVRFNTMVGCEELAGDYDRVVVATGSGFFAMDRGYWSDIFRAWARGAVVEGRFDPTAMVVWFNKAYANNGYGYLGAFNAEKASLILIVSDVREEEVEFQMADVFGYGKNFLPGNREFSPGAQRRYLLSKAVWKHHFCRQRRRTFGLHAGVRHLLFYN